MASTAPGAPTRRGVFARKPHDQIAAEDGLERAVGVLDLTALGIGAIIDTGIFVIGDFNLPAAGGDQPASAAR